MTEHRIEELANDVAAEVSLNLKGFGIERVEKIGDALLISFSWKRPFCVEVTVNLHDHDTDESVKSEIRRQLQAGGPRFF